MDIFLTGPLASLAGKSEDALKKVLFNDDGEFKEDATGIFAKLVLDKFKKQKEEQYNRGFKAAKRAAEDATKPLFEAYEVNLTDFDKYEEALTELSSKIKEQRAVPGKGSGPQTLTAEEIKKHEVFISALEDAKNGIVDKWQKQYDTLQSEYDTFKKDHSQKHLRSVVSRKTKAALTADDKQPLYGTAGEDKAITAFWATFGWDKVRLDENDEPYLVNKDGTALRDEMENTISFDQAVEKEWLFGFKQAAGNGSPPHPNSGGGKKFNTNSPSELQEALRRETDPKKKSELLRAYADKMKK